MPYWSVLTYRSLVIMTAYYNNAYFVPTYFVPTYAARSRICPSEIEGELGGGHCAYSCTAVGAVAARAVLGLGAAISGLDDQTRRAVCGRLARDGSDFAAASRGGGGGGSVHR
eukprot:COSAG06_NODE_13564_length_1244_cov_1.457642_2_plen_112_part_01